AGMGTAPPGAVPGRPQPRPARDAVAGAGAGYTQCRPDRAVAPHRRPAGRRPGPAASTDGQGAAVRATARPPPAPPAGRPGAPARQAGAAATAGRAVRLTARHVPGHRRPRLEPAGLA